MNTENGSIYVSPHAIRQAKDRFGWRDVAYLKVVAQMAYEVGEALRAGRRAKTMPRWVAIHARSKAGGRVGKSRPRWYVWNAERTRCYVVGLPDRRNDADWVILTAMQASGKEE